jgi:TonB family protein
MTPQANPLRPYVVNSGLAHFALLSVLLPLKGKTPVFSPSYTIDFVGPPSPLTNTPPSASHQAPPSARVISPAATKAAAPAALTRRRPLPPPSLLDGSLRAVAPRPASASLKAVATPAASAEATNTAGAAAMPALSTEINFPSPWYLTRLRSMLWDSWNKDRPSQPGAATVVFTLLRDGRVTDLKVETSSGDSAFDLAAQGAVADGEPYPPLPSEFREPFLKIHATMSSQ